MAMMVVLLQGNGVKQHCSSLTKESPRYRRGASPSCRNNQQQDCFAHPDKKLERDFPPHHHTGGLLKWK